MGHVELTQLFSEQGVNATVQTNVR